MTDNRELPTLSGTIHRQVVLSCTEPVAELACAVSQRLLFQIPL